MSLQNPNDLEYDYLFKILIIGDAGVGKTAILQRFSQNYFATEYLATVGVDFQIRNVDVDSKRCKLQLWDTAGQDRFKCIVTSFYRGAHGIMICFDITDVRSFNNIDKWLKEVEKHCQPHIPVYLVGTKLDLESKRQVLYSTVKEYADEKHLSYIETSSKTANNVDICFTNFAKELVTHTDQGEHFDTDKHKKETRIILPSNPKPVTTSRGCAGSKKCTI